ncbi:MAG TPA: YgiT-type zinc finger protein, partial [bacterium]
TNSKFNSKLRMKLTYCPICNSTKLKTVTGELSFETAIGEVEIPEVTRIRCQVCHEEFFDHAANVILDQYRGKSNHSCKKGKGSLPQ